MKIYTEAMGIEIEIIINSINTSYIENHAMKMWVKAWNTKFET